MTKPRLPKRILMLGFENAQILDVTGPFEILEAARTRSGEPAYEIELIAPEPGPFRTSCGLTLTATRGIDEIGDEELGQVHSLLVAGGMGTRKLAHDTRVIGFIRRAAARTKRTVSVCTGALLLAGAGLLDGKRAATHWAFAETLRRDFPKIEVDPDAIYVRAGKIWTSAGVTAGMDLALALVEEDLDREAALAIARQLVMFLMRPGGQSQFSAQLAAQGVSDERIARVCSHIVGNPRDDLSVPALAAHAYMSERTFARRFAEATGLTPAQFVERARLDEARRRLTEGSAPVETVAHHAGFGQAERMRRAFLRHLGVTPNRYRERFLTAKRPISINLIAEERLNVS